MGSQVKLLLLAAFTGSDGTASALQDVDGMPAINHWLTAAKSSTRLSPLKDKIFIITSSDHYQAFTAWAKSAAKSMGGFPVDNIIDNGVSGYDGEGSVSNIMTYLRATGHAEEHLVVAEADFLYEPNFNLQRIIEHSLVRGKDVLTYVVLPPGEGLAPHTLVGFDDPASVTPRVEVIEPSPSSELQANGSTDSVMAPLLVLRRTTLTEVVAAASTGSPLPGTAEGKQLGHLVGRLLASRPFYGLPMDLMVTSRYADSLVFTRDFFKHYHTESGGTKGIAARALTNAADLAMAQRSDPVFMQLLAVSSPIKQLYLKFYVKYRPDQEQANDPTSTSTKSVPERFADVTTRRHAPRSQHPVYETTNNSYGLKAPVQVEMPDSYHGTSSFFTKTFGTLGMPRDASLVVAMTRSKVHNKLDEFSSCHR